MKLQKINTDLILFDLDGTLVDSGHDIANAVNYTLETLGMRDRSFKEIVSYIGSGVEDLIIKSLGGQKGKLKKALRIFEDYYMDHITDKSSLYPGVKDILEYFKDKKKVIITNRNHKFAVLAMNNLGILDYFADILGGDDLSCMKPSSCPVNKIVNKFHADKKRAIMVGDMAIDVSAGKEAGISTCAVTYGIGKKEDIVKSKPDYIIDSILELKEIIK